MGGATMRNPSSLVVSDWQYIGPSLQLGYSADGRLYVSCSTDGSIKVWDGTSSRCVNTFAGAHSGAEVCRRKMAYSLLFAY